MLHSAVSSNLEYYFPLDGKKGGGWQAYVMIVLFCSVLFCEPLLLPAQTRSFHWSWNNFNKSLSIHVYILMPILLTIQLFGFRWLKVRKRYRMRLCSIILRNHLMKSYLLSLCQGLSSHSGTLVFWLQLQSCHFLMTWSVIKSVLINLSLET